MDQIPFLSGLSEIVGDYRAILCDLWGVLHDGETGNGAAIDALERARAGGRPVALLTNVPRPGTLAAEGLARYGITARAFDAVVTSGDVGRAMLAGMGDRRVLHIGKQRNRVLFDGLDVRPVAEAEADCVVCTSLVDEDRESPEDYRSQLARLAARGLDFLCLNPDVVAQRGARLVPCAGALARLYAELGGRVTMTGKPEKPIYRMALARLSAIAGRELAAAEVLAIGDGLATDIAGAAAAGIDALLVTSGVHAGEFGPPARPDPARLAARLAAAGLAPRAAMVGLAW